MSISSEISRLQTAKADLKTAIENKGVTVPSSALIDAYADYVDDITGGITPEQIATNNFLSGPITINAAMVNYAFYYKGKSASPWTLHCTGSILYNSALKYTSGLTMLVLTNAGYGPNASYSCSGDLQTLDTAEPRLPGNAWQNCSSLKTVILRSTSIVTLNNVNVVSGSPFASGGSGGTIYIPKSLYDHLGDGTASDYKAATNWSTIDGYGTVTWACIEGSIYENQYADGVVITAA